MKKSEAVKILIADFHNKLIARGYKNIKEIEDNTDKKLAEVFKLDFSK